MTTDDNLRKIIHNKEFDLFESIGQVVEPSHVNEIVEVGWGQTVEEILLAVVDDEQALEMSGRGNHVEYVRVGVEASVRRVDDLDHFLEATCTHAL